MSDIPTPRTDKQEYYYSNHDSCAGESLYRVIDDRDVTCDDQYSGFSVTSNFARQLERELAEAREIAEMQKETMRQLREQYGIGERNVMRELRQQRDTLAEALEGKLTDKAMSAMIDAYEDAMGGCRLPDGDGYDYEVVAAMFKAAVKGGQHDPT